MRVPSVASTRESSHVNGGTDRRRHSRAGVVINITYLLEGASEESVGASDDVGGGGLRLATREPLAIGTVLLLRFLMPSSKREIIARGRIVMSFYEAASKRYKHGIAFTQIEPNGTEAIVSFVESELQRHAFALQKPSKD